MEAPDRSDEQLLLAVSDGDVTALRDLCARHAPWLSVRLRRRCNDADLLASAIQDCFAAVWSHTNRWRGDGEISAGSGALPSAGSSPACGAAAS
jgi:RNA polymerase sigma-70 factor (ECF subfamily)